MAVRAELTSRVVLITGAIIGAIIGALGVELYIAYVVPASDTSAPLPGAMDVTYTRRLADASDDVPFIQNASNTRCAPGGDRSFPAFKTDLPGCYAKCSETPGCNHFAIALSGEAKGWCNGCGIGVSDFREHFVLYSIKRDEATSLSCSVDNSAASINLDNLVDGEIPYQVCITKEGDDEPTCSDLRSDGQANASINFCAPSSSTSTSSTISTTSSTSTSSSTSSDGFFFPNNKNELQQAVNMWLSNKPAANEYYGHISTWKTLKITDMSWLFYTASPYISFNDDISGWDVSQVTNMAGMFLDNFNFNQDLSAWDVSKVTNMGSMFSSNTFFNQDLSAWDVSKVTNMQHMFADSGFNGDISAWNVGQVTTMESMFSGNSAFNQDISGWDVSSVTNMDYMFYSATAFAGGVVDIGVWSPTSLTSRPLAFIPDNALPCYQGTWINWPYIVRPYCHQ